MDADTLKLWTLIVELSEQLNNDRGTLLDLKRQTSQLQEKAKEARSVYSVNRYNVDITKETFESELERNNTAIVLENQALLYENNQLSTILKEYEQTLQTIMTRFRNHAQATAQHEVSLKRHYETLLASQEAGSPSPDRNTAQMNFAHTVQRLTYLLKLAINSTSNSFSEDDAEPSSISPIDATTLEASFSKLSNAEAAEEREDVAEEEEGVARQDWAVERESEIQRLEKENAYLRRMLGIYPGDEGYSEEERRSHGVGTAISPYNVEAFRQLKRAATNGLASPRSQSGRSQIGIDKGYRELSPPIQVQLQPPVNNNINGFTPLTLRAPPRKPGLWSMSGTQAITGSNGSPLGLYRNVSLPSTGNGQIGDTLRR